MSDEARHRIGVVGVRDQMGVLYANRSYVFNKLDEYLTERGLTYASVCMVTGRSKGTEDLAAQWAEAHSIDCLMIPPNIQEFGAKKAFEVRNNRVVEKAASVIVFWDGKVTLIAQAVVTAVRTGKIATVYPLF